MRKVTFAVLLYAAMVLTAAGCTSDADKSLPHSEGEIIPTDGDTTHSDADLTSADIGSTHSESEEMLSVEKTVFSDAEEALPEEKRPKFSVDMEKCEEWEKVFYDESYKFLYSEWLRTSSEEEKQNIEKYFGDYIDSNVWYDINRTSVDFNEKGLTVSVSSGTAKSEDFPDFVAQAIKAASEVAAEKKLHVAWLFVRINDSDKKPVLSWSKLYNSPEYSSVSAYSVAEGVVLKSAWIPVYPIEIQDIIDRAFMHQSEISYIAGRIRRSSYPIDEIEITIPFGKGNLPQIFIYSSASLEDDTSEYVRNFGVHIEAVTKALRESASEKGISVGFINIVLRTKDGNILWESSLDNNEIGNLGNNITKTYYTDIMLEDVQTLIDEEF